MPPKDRSPQSDSSRLEAAVGIAKFIGEFGVVAAKTIGGDVLRLCGLSRPPKDSTPPTWTEEEVREFNIRNGFRRNWRL